MLPRSLFFERAFPADYPSPLNPFSQPRASATPVHTHHLLLLLKFLNCSVRQKLCLSFEGKIQTVEQLLVLSSPAVTAVARPRPPGSLVTETLMKSSQWVCSEQGPSAELGKPGEAFDWAEQNQRKDNLELCG